MNKITFIGYPKCSTCKKAYQTLEDLGIHAEYRDITKENPTVDEIKSWIDRGVELKQLFSQLPTPGSYFIPALVFKYAIS